MIVYEGVNEGVNEGVSRGMNGQSEGGGDLYTWLDPPPAK